MKITVTIDQPTGDFQDRLLALLAEHAANVEIDTSWTVPRAENYFTRLPPRAQRIVRQAVARGGYVAADDLRDSPEASLRGHSGALTRALRSGAMGGDWPDGMPLPVLAQGPGFGKVVGYRVPDELLDVFRTAVTNIDGQPPTTEK
ncbi:hypothetical protein D0Z67_29540 (plasmid) [Streptomyces seoulensis]|uniref:Uncharacterized protein n=1 Tax=Streptomyces seoulensis TaxID=73044 RepID=A0A4P6U520_STRSO|nr:hypothetical protein [Streptomyces seoulensis]QBJ94513.1 hypothetical protein D0Z67_29540 [Streptomyces seoulensis]